jgi:endonuclease/exonuclease/phosphatase family metal-dependent hydrolase
MRLGMKIMTFNLRFENDRDEENAWVRRRDLVIEIINLYQPDILGTQEGKWTQLTYLQEQLPAYAAVLPGRVPDPHIQCPTLFFRKNGHRLEEAGDFWLSRTPMVHLSKDWDSAFPRMLTYAGVYRETSGEKIMVADTHLDHVGVEARFQQARIIAQWVNDQKLPVILMGDFNDAPGTRTHALLTQPETRLCDTWERVEGCESQESFTHHGFSGKPQISRMDWILADAAFRVRTARVIRDAFDGRYPSDHFPYMAEIDL